MEEKTAKVGRNRGPWKVAESYKGEGETGNEGAKRVSATDVGEKWVKLGRNRVLEKEADTEKGDGETGY